MAEQNTNAVETPEQESGAALPPVEKHIHVRLAPEDAFRVFTAEISRWWPLERFSIGQERAVSCELEGEVGGKIRERVEGGEEHVWGTVRVWEPPARLIFSWHPGRSPREETEVEVRFSAEGEGTRVELEHRGWEVLGAAAAEIRGGYEPGWEEVFCRRFAGHADRSVA